MTLDKWNDFRRRLFTIIEVGNDGDFPSRLYDLINTLSIVLNLAISIALTFDSVREKYGAVLLAVESLTYLFFTVDFVLRLITARCLYPRKTEAGAAWKYVSSFSGIVDLLSFLPYYLPMIFPGGVAAFRLFRVVRIFRLFRINVYYDSLNVITEVIVSKSQQLLSSVFIILVLMVASSLCMYSLEHEAQPEVFSNAFSGIWWSVSTLFTIGYGDIYPITALGQVFSIIITFLGVGMVAIPTGIISAGFVDQYSRVKRFSEYGSELDVHFIKVHIRDTDEWRGKSIRELHLPHGMIAAAIQRREGIVVPRGDIVLEPGDVLVLGAEALKDDKYIDLKEVTLSGRNPWINEYIRDLDISRKTVIVMVKRKDKVMIPRGDLMLQEGDEVFLYTQRHIRDAERIQV